MEWSGLLVWWAEEWLWRKYCYWCQATTAMGMMAATRPFTLRNNAGLNWVDLFSSSLMYHITMLLEQYKYMYMIEMKNIKYYLWCRSVDFDIYLGQIWIGYIQYIPHTSVPQDGIHNPFVCHTWCRNQQNDIINNIYHFLFLSHTGTNIYYVQGAWWYGTLPVTWYLVPGVYQGQLTTKY